MATFIGMSTVDTVRAPYVLTDDDLIKRDLLNEFNTKRGERVMRPTFGSIIWELLMDPDSSTLQEQVDDDIKKIIGRDPRVKLLKVNTLVAEHALRSEVIIEYVASANPDTLYLNYTIDAQEGVI